MEKLLLNLISREVDSVMIFLSSELDESLIPLFKTKDFNSTNVFFAVSEQDQMESLSTVIPAEQILNSTNISFIDQVKMITKGEGFQEVGVFSESPSAIRQGLGVAGVFGTVYLFFPPSVTVKADLHNTINYKSLKVIGCQI